MNGSNDMSEEISEEEFLEHQKEINNFINDKLKKLDSIKQSD